MFLKTIFLCLLVVLIQPCQDTNCLDCSNQLSNDTGTLSIKQTCSQCNLGWSLRNQRCQEDIYLPIWLGIGALVAIILEFICYQYCHNRNLKRNQKKAINFRQIFGQKKKQEIMKIRHLQLQGCRQQFQGHICYRCHKNATVKTSCNHYFDLKCFYEEVEAMMTKEKQELELQIVNRNEKRKQQKRRRDQQLKTQDKSLQDEQIERTIVPKCPQCNNDRLIFEQVCIICRSRKVQLRQLMQTAETCREYECAHCMLRSMYHIENEQEKPIQSHVKIQSEDIQKQQ